MLATHPVLRSLTFVYTYSCGHIVDAEIPLFPPFSSIGSGFTGAETEYSAASQFDPSQLGVEAPVIMIDTQTARRSLHGSRSHRGGPLILSGAVEGLELRRSNESSLPLPVCSRKDE